MRYMGYGVVLLILLCNRAFTWTSPYSLLSIRCITTALSGTFNPLQAPVVQIAKVEQVISSESLHIELHIVSRYGGLPASSIRFNCMRFCTVSLLSNFTSIEHPESRIETQASVKIESRVVRREGI